MYINQIFFRAQYKEFCIQLQAPIKGETFAEIREKAEKEVELYMLKNSISGPYQLLLI